MHIIICNLFLTDALQLYFSSILFDIYILILFVNIV